MSTFSSSHAKPISTTTAIAIAIATTKPISMTTTTAISTTTTTAIAIATTKPISTTTSISTTTATAIATSATTTTAIAIAIATTTTNPNTTINQRPREVEQVGRLADGSHHACEHPVVIPVGCCCRASAPGINNFGMISLWWRKLIRCSSLILV